MCEKMRRRIWKLLFVTCLYLGCSVAPIRSEPVAPIYVPNNSPSDSNAEKNIQSGPTLPTVTVRGFLNFRTTVDGTVIVFTPASESPQEPTPVSPSHSIVTASASSISPRSDNVQHLSYEKNRHELENEANTGDDRRSFRHLKPGLSELTTPEDEVQNINNGGAPEKSSNGPTPALPEYPTGLVTVLGGTHVENGATTVFETKVIGTYIEGKYAQILQSTSQIIFAASKSPKQELSTPKPTPSRMNLETQKTSALTSSLQPTNQPEVTSKIQQPVYGTTPKESKTTIFERRKDEPLNANAVLQASFKLPDTTSNRVTTPTQSLEKSHSRASYSRRFRPTVSTDVPEDENTVPESQSTRRLPPRFRYVLPRRNTPSVRLNRFKVKLTMRNDGGATDSLVTPPENTFDTEDDLLDDYGSLQGLDPARVIYEKTTITSEVTLHVGRRKSVRTLTITTSVPRTRHVYVSDALSDAHDIQPANNNAIFATSILEGETIPQIVVTRTYTTTERMLKTSVVPILDGDTTSYHTVTESFFILKLITGYKTMPPSDLTILSTEQVDTDIDTTAVPDSGIDSLLEGAIPIESSPKQQILQTPVPNGLLHMSGSGREQAIVPLESPNSKPLDLSNSLLSLGAALQKNPLAAVYLGLQQLNRQVTLYSTITKTSTYVATDTIYSTKVVSFYDGRRTRSRTLSESISTTERTMTSYTTTVEPYLNTQLFQQNQLQQLLGTQLTGGLGPQLPPPPPQYSTVTSTYTTVTTATSLSTRVYTLIYNAISTKFRTVTSTSLYETTITATTTSEVPIAITAPPGGVFPFLG